ncbi:uncharacterized protein LOC134228651 [Saccostrea cucullata]|uniref:uncharacterized protein LOC134228651 n=1 Tax=Saccostrea cuccullata TaxID=36930 RepID=UPI002ECFFE72
MTSLNMSTVITEEMQHMSQMVFVGFCSKLGTSEQVTMRRDVGDFSELMMILFSETNPEFRVMFSGSHKEGFRLNESDRDIMISLDNYRVTWDLSQTQRYSRHTLVLSDCSKSPPGFTLLQLLLPAVTTTQIWSACFSMHGKLYISSSRFRNTMYLPSRPDSHAHGPCRSGTFKGVDFEILTIYIYIYGDIIFMFYPHSHVGGETILISTHELGFHDLLPRKHKIPGAFCIPHQGFALHILGAFRRPPDPFPDRSYPRPHIK